MDIKLVIPNEDHEEEARDFLGEFQIQTEIKNLGLGMEDMTYFNWLENIRRNNSLKTIGQGMVPYTTYFLTKGPSILGMVDIRHDLNTYLLMYGGHIGYRIREGEKGKGYGYLALELALEKCRELGMKRVLLTCSDWNLPSRKIILKNGGVLENVVRDNDDIKERYWVEI